MVDVYGGPFGTYPAITGIIVAAVQDEVALQLVELARLLGITLTADAATAGSYVLVEGTDSPHPDFDAIRPEMRDKIGKELASIWDVVDAAPVT